MPELSVNMPMSGDSARLWHIWGTSSRSWDHLQTLHCAPQLHQSQPFHKKGPNRDDAILLSPKSKANRNIQNLNHNFTADLLFWSQHTVTAPESCILYLEIAICEMSCYFRRGWLGNRINLNFLPPGYSSQAIQQSSINNSIVLWWPGAAFSLLAFWCHAAAQEDPHGEAGINPFKTKGVIQLGDRSMVEADSKKVIKAGKFCTSTCAVILQAGTPLMRWLDSSLCSIPDRDSTEQSPLNHGSMDGNLLRWAQSVGAFWDLHRDHAVCILPPETMRGTAIMGFMSLLENRPTQYHSGKTAGFPGKF